MSTKGKSNLKQSTAPGGCSSSTPTPKNKKTTTKNRDENVINNKNGKIDNQQQEQLISSETGSNFKSGINEPSNNNNKNKNNNNNNNKNNDDNDLKKEVGPRASSNKRKGIVLYSSSSEDESNSKQNKKIGLKSRLSTNKKARHPEASRGNTPKSTSGVYSSNAGTTDHSELEVRDEDMLEEEEEKEEDNDQEEEIMLCAPSPKTKTKNKKTIKNNDPQDIPSGVQSDLLDLPDNPLLDLNPPFGKKQDSITQEKQSRNQNLNATGSDSPQVDTEIHDIEFPLDAREYLSQDKFSVIREIVEESGAYCRLSMLPNLFLKFLAIGTLKEVALAIFLMTIKLENFFS